MESLNPKPKLMKKLFLIFLYFCTSFSGFSQTLHAIIFADTFDAMIGESCFHDYERMNIELSTMATANEMTLNRYFFRGKDFNKAKLLEVIESINCKPDDTIFFYYSGHGARAEADKSTFPQLAFGKTDADFVPLLKIDELLGNKKSRLRLIFADCCNSYQPEISNKLTDNTNNEATNLAQATINTYQSLLKKVQGSVIACSSKPGENSLALPVGGLFTVSFLYELQKMVVRNADVSWLVMLDNTSKLTTDLSSQIMANKITQNPYFETKLKPVTENSNNNTNSEKPQENLQNTPQNTVNDTPDKVLLGGLQKLCNKNIAVEERINQIKPLLDKCFASPTAKVEIMGKNGTTLIDRKSAEDFLKRLAITKRLAGIVLLDGMIDENGKFTELKVHEIYK